MPVDYDPSINFVSARKVGIDTRPSSLDHQAIRVLPPPHRSQGALEVVQTLLGAGADVCARDSAGGTALHAATLRRHVHVARALLEAGCDSNATDQGNNTPLHTLAASGAGPGGGGGSGGGEATGAELVSLLLEWGASADIKNSAGLTPISAALDARNRALVLAYRNFFGEDGGMKLVGEVGELDSRECSP